MFAKFFFSGARYSKQGQGEESAKVSGTHSTISSARSQPQLSRKAEPKSILAFFFAYEEKRIVNGKHVRLNVSRLELLRRGSLFMLRLEIVAFQAAKAIARNYLRPLHIARRILFGVKSVGMRILANLAIQLCVICLVCCFAVVFSSPRLSTCLGQSAWRSPQKTTSNLMQF